MPLVIGSGIGISGGITIASEPTYAFTAPATATVYEGGTVTYNIVTTFVGSATLYYTIEAVSGTVNDADFSSPVNAVSAGGAVTITNNAGSFTFTLADAAPIEGNDSFLVRLRTGSTAGPIVATSNTITIGENIPTYAFTTPATSTVVEGNTITYTVATTFVANGTNLYWTIEAVSGTVNNADFSSPASAVTAGGSVTINSNAATFTLTLADDLTSETESFLVRLRTDSTSGTIVATSNTITTADITYAFTAPATATVDEGSTISYTVSTTNFGSGTLYWTIEGVSGTINDADFSSPASAVSAGGSVTITANSGSFSLTISNDVTTEGTESYRVNLRKTSTSGTIVATSNTTTITDSSKPYDGATWRSSTNILDSPTNSVVKTQNAVVLGGNYYTYRSTVAPGTLTPLSTWTKTLLYANGGPSTWAVQGGNVTLIDQANGNVARSTDGGASFTLSTGFPTFYVFIVAWNGSVFCAAGANGQIATSPDGLTWTNRTGLSSTAFGSSQNVNCIGWGGGQFVVIGGAGGCATSPDGITWTYRAGLSQTSWGASGFPSSKHALAYSTGLGLWAVASGSNSGGMAWSADGVSWSYGTGLVTTWGGARAAYTMVGTSSHLLAFGDQGYLARSTNGSTWTNLMGIRNTSSGTFVSGGQAIFTGSNILYAGNYGGSSGGLLVSP